ncbi:Protein of unknown function [Micromonospora lupini str. Lupac 08]|uniref:Uncharacterized protein n=1 Tax=Micromonospora lupini str. Lupac 08 TaxID=1150864 RepID=I0KWD8_9ACTN|nr:Protein of unknown function [Micromonospora lupini str. Lupac 08]
MAHRRRNDRTAGSVGSVGRRDDPQRWQHPGRRLLAPARDRRRRDGGPTPARHGTHERVRGATPARHRTHERVRGATPERPAPGRLASPGAPGAGPAPTPPATGRGRPGHGRAAFPAGHLRLRRRGRRGACRSRLPALLAPHLLKRRRILSGGKF